MISGGEKNNIHYIKNILLSHDAVDDVSLKILKSKKWGQIIEADIVLNRSINKSEIKAWYQQKLPKYSIPKKINLIKAVTK